MSLLLNGMVIGLAFAVCVLAFQVGAMLSRLGRLETRVIADREHEHKLPSGEMTAGIVYDWQRAADYRSIVQ